MTKEELEELAKKKEEEEFSKVRQSKEKKKKGLFGGAASWTGDMGKMDADGFLFITGRSKDVINRGGELPTRPTQLDSALVRTASDVHSWPLTKHHVAAVWQL